MRRQMAKVVCYGVYTIVYDDKERFNKYKVYYTANGHRKLLDKYANLFSGLALIADRTRNTAMHME